MSFGIGLGGFMDGYQKMGDIMRSEAADGRRAKLEQRQDAEYNRAVKQREEVDAVNTDTRKQFDSLVQTGEKKPEQFDQFWNEYAMPKLKQTYLAQGDMENAKKVSEWGETEAAKTGGRLFSSAMLKAQTGDSAGALDDIIKAGQVKGYIEHGYELEGRDDLIGPDGKMMGYRLKVKTATGEVVEQDIKMDDLPKMIATFANPEAAWQSHLAAQAEEQKEQRELKTYAAKKEIDKAYGVGGGSKSRPDAISALRKRLDGGLAGDEPKFDDLAGDEKERLIAEEISLQTGQPGLEADPAAARPQRKVIVDDVTGEAVPAAQSKSSPEKEPVTAVAGASRKPQTREESVAYAIGNAAERVGLGDNPEIIAQDLLNHGIPEEQWPPELRQALAKKTASRETRAIGLGG